MPLQKYSGESEESICSGCKFLPTKPESVPDEIGWAVANSFELAELQAAEAKFNYPDSLSAFDWVCLRGLTRGRERAKKLQEKRDEKKRKIEEKKKNLNG